MTLAFIHVGPIHNNHRALLVAYEPLPQQRINSSPLTVQAAIGQQAIGSLDTMFLFGLAGNGPPEMRHRQYLPAKGRHHVHKKRRATSFVHLRADFLEEFM